MWKQILVPHDFSDCAAHALDVAIGLARLSGGTITVLHVSSLPPNLPRAARVLAGNPDAPVRIDDLVSTGAERDLHAVTAPLVACGVSVRARAVVTESGDVSSAILDEAARAGSGAIVLGTHGRRGLAHLLLGSITEKIIRRASIPVVTVRTPAPESPLTADESRAEDELAG